MFNEFLARYKKYSNVELLKIIKRPDGYLPDALKAAAQIISTRNITEEEQKEADSYFEALELTEKIRKEKIDSLTHKVKDFFEPVLRPGSTIKAGKWLNIFLLLVVIQYVWTLYETVDYFIIFFRCVGCEFGILEYGYLLILLYIPLIFYLLYKRKRWGWILLLADNSTTALLSAEQTYQGFKYPYFYDISNQVDHAWSLVISLAFVFFLWKEDIAAFFNIDETNKKKYTLRIALVVVILTGSIIAMPLLL